MAFPVRAREGRRSLQRAPLRPPLPFIAMVRHIRRNLSRRIAIAELATIARLSVYQLLRAFRRHHAITPYDFVLAIKIRQSRWILQSGTSIAETASLVGFADQSHFTRHFKRLTGETPRRFVATSDQGHLLAVASAAARTGPSRRATHNPANPAGDVRLA